VVKSIKNKFKKFSLDFKVWSYYKRGMYKTASSFDNNALLCRGLFAKCVSLAACGKFKESEEVLNLFKRRMNCARYYIKLADALAPFMPNIALSLLEEKRSPLPLYAALLLKLNENEKAYSLLHNAIQKKVYRQYPELLLYFTNATKDIEPKKQLTLVNKFLLMYKIPKLKLKDKTKPFSTLNIDCQLNEKTTGALVTIIMTTYKTGHRADVAIESILKQTYQNIELIVVDDASDDDTPHIIEEWMNKDNRIKLIRLKQNVGTYVAKNIALLQAKGKFVTCHDSDDWSHPLKIEHQVRPLLQNRHLIATISSWIRLSDDGEYYARPVHSLARQNPSSLLFRKNKVLKYAGIWDCVRTGADSEYIARLKLIFGRIRVKRIKEPLSFGAHRNDSLMTSSDTGYCDLGMSPQRLDYWEAWGNWHINETRKGKKPFLCTDILAKRKFEAPSSILVPKKDIKVATKGVR